VFIDLTFRCGVPDEHFPQLQESISESVVGMQNSKIIQAEIRAGIPLADGKVQYIMIGQLVGADEVHILGPGEDATDDPGYKDKKKRANAAN
jgi:hypothetical protein